MNVRTERTGRNVRTERLTSGEDAGEVQVAARPECPEPKCADPHDAALAAYQRLKPEARAELETEAQVRLKHMLDRLGEPDHRAAMVERSVLHELEDPRVRERFGL